MPERWVDEELACPAECGGSAQPEYDGEIRYHACTSCGYEFGYQRVPAEPGACSAGVSEDVRRRFSEPARQPGQPVLLQIGRRP